jgi:asparagine synthase (glutamine-hydrolysing)
MIVTADGIKIERYWDLGVEVAAEEESMNRWDVRTREERFFNLLQDAVQLRLCSDVALGACLSGGLDSSAIVSLASSRIQDLPTFTSVFEDSSCDESHFALQVEKRYRTRPHHVRPDVQGFKDALSRMIWFQDEPGAAYGIFPQWKVMEEASRHVRVILDGQGGDEILAGYHHFLPHYLKTLQEDPTVDSKVFRENTHLINMLYGPDFAGPYKGAMEDVAYRNRALATDLRADAAVPVRDFRGPFSHHMNNVLYMALTRDILPGLLHYQDRMSMAFSLESRVPFLDYRLVKFCFAIPYGAKIRQGMTKAILRDAFAGMVPDSIRGRRDKMGFPAPFSKWIREDLRPLVSDLLLSNSSAERGILDPGTVARRLEEHMEGRTDHTWEIWRWLSTEIWFREFIDRPMPGSGRVEVEA